MIHIRLAPKRSTAHPVSGMTVASASRYPVYTHWTVDSGRPEVLGQGGMATLTMVVSRIDMMVPSTTTRASRLSWGSRPDRPVAAGASARGASPGGAVSGLSPASAGPAWPAPR